MAISSTPLKNTVAPQAEAPSKAALGKSSQRKTADLLLLIATSIILITFAVGTCLSSSQDKSIEEKRALAPMPKLRTNSPEAFPSAFEQFYNDRLFQRQTLVKARALSRYSLFGVGDGTKIVGGKNGWLYLISNWCGPDVRHENQTSPKALDEWQQAMVYRTRWLEAHGIRYLFVVAPNKDSIYPEYLPDAYKPIRAESRLDQIENRLRTTPVIHFLNLSAAMREAKAHGDILYYKTDTHWNDLGAYVAYRRIAKQLSEWYPQLQPAQISKADIEYRRMPGGDCADMMGVNNCLHEVVPTIKMPFSEPAPNALPLRVLVLHDSFGPSLKPYLAQTFLSVTYKHQSDLDLDLERLAKDKPDIIIQEVVERNVAQLVPEMHDWRHWAMTEIAANSSSDEPVWLDIVPSTEQINVNRFNRYVEDQSHKNVHATTCRTYTEHGDEVRFSTANALFHQWYLLKTGPQGVDLADTESKQDYQKLVDFISNSQAFKKVGTCPMADGTALSLYKQSK